ncbi:MAG: hypothetical protein JW881_10455 [Spirochaetales bacterium]|nr:hypothetical protein [Spirochaetales bacterium]
MTEVTNFNMLDELEDIETPTARDFMEGFAIGFTIVVGTAALALAT